MCIVEVCVSGMQADRNGLCGCQVGRFRLSYVFDLALGATVEICGILGLGLGLFRVLSSA